jgi:hypothetical protein
MCAEVSSSVPHFVQAGSLLSPITCRCLLRVLCPVSRPITALVCVLLKDSNRAPVARLGPEINSRACLCVLQGPRHTARCWFLIQRFNFCLIFCLETHKKGSGPINRWPEPLLASLSAVSFPLTPTTGNQLISWERKTRWYRLYFTKVKGTEEQRIEGRQGNSAACKLSERDVRYIFTFPQQPRGDP